MRSFYLLSFAFICPLVLVINPTEVGHDDGDGQSDDEHTAQRANAAYNLTRNRFGYHVSVPVTNIETNNQ